MKIVFDNFRAARMALDHIEVEGAKELFLQSQHAPATPVSAHSRDTNHWVVSDYRTGEYVQVVRRLA